LPKITLYYIPGFVSTNRQGFGWTEKLAEKFGTAIRPLVAEMCSIDEAQLSEDDVDFVAVPYPAGSIASASLEIETFAYPARVEKLTEARLLQFKRAAINIVNVPGFVEDHGHSKPQGYLGFDEETPLVWLKYVDPRGHHV
jgi:hypothetical protein